MCALVLLQAKAEHPSKFSSTLIMICYAYKIIYEAITCLILIIQTEFENLRQIPLIHPVTITYGCVMKATKAMVSFEVSSGALQFRCYSGV